MPEGYIQIQRALLSHPSVVSAPVAQRWVLITIIENCCFKPTKFDDHGVTFELKQGEVMVTVRKLAEWANVDKNDVERAIARFSKVEILRQEVRHKKSILAMLWGVEYGECETRNETKVRQERDTNEERKNETPSFSSLKKETKKKEKIVRPLFRSSLLHEEDLNALVASTEFNNRGVSLDNFSLWIKKHDLEELVWSTCQMLDMKAIKNTPAATIQWILTARLYFKHLNSESNKKFAEDMKSENNLTSLVITKQYARDSNTGYDFQYNWDCEMFEKTICEKYNIQKQKGA